MIELRSIQQYLYCPHRFGLIENECSWAENVFVNRGNLAHKRVNDGKYSSLSGSIQHRSLRVYNDEWGIFGVLDCLELRKSEAGVYISAYEDKYTVSIVEYKVTAPKAGQIRRDEHMQLLGQKICVDSLLGCDCKTYFYYTDTHRRDEIKFCADDYVFISETLKSMREIKKTGKIPPIRNDQYCKGCSMKDICLPPKRTNQ